MSFGSNDGQTTQRTSFRRKLDVGTTTSHVGSNGYHSQLTRFGNNISLALMEFGIQNLVLNTTHLQHSAQQFRDFHRGGSHKHWLTYFIQPDDFVNNSVVFLFLSFVNVVFVIFTDYWLICRNYNNLQFINIPEFTCFSLGSSGHPRQFVVHAEIILKCDGRKSLCSILNFNTLSRFDRLVKTIGVAATFHDTTRLLINNLNLAINQHIFNILFEHCICCLLYTSDAADE